MWGLWAVIAVVCFLIWAWISLSQKISGDKHQKEARRLAGMGNWQDAALEYKLAIIARLDSEMKLAELVQELTNLYRSQGIVADLGRLHECPKILQTLGSDTRNQSKKTELIKRLYTETGVFLDSLPGAKTPNAAAVPQSIEPR